MILTGTRPSARFPVQRGTGFAMSRAFVAAGVFAAALLASSSAADARVAIKPATAQAGRPAVFTGTSSDTGSFRLRLVDADGHASASFGPFSAGPDGKLSGTIPASLTRDVHVSPDNDYRAV